MANYSVFTNINGAIQTHSRGAVLRPQYHVFKLYTNHMGGELLDSEIISEKFQTNMPVDRRVFNDYYNEAAVEKGGRLRSEVERFVSRDVDYLDSVATIDEKNKEISISLINKNLNDAIECSIEISGNTIIKSSQMHSIWSADIKDFNSGNTEKVSIQSSVIEEPNAKMKISIPRHSIQVLTLKY